MADTWLSALPPVKRVEAIELTIVDLLELRDEAIREMSSEEYVAWRARRREETKAA